MSSFLAYIYSIMLLKLCKKSQGKSIIKATIDSSPFLGTILGVVLSIFFITLSFVYIRDFEDFMGTQYIKTPTLIIGLLLIFICAFSVKSGVEVTARVAQLLVIPVLLSIFLVLITSMFFFNLTPLYVPIENWSSFTKGIIEYLPKVCELVVLVVLVPILDNSKRNHNSIILFPLILNSIIIIMLTLVLYGVLGNSGEGVTYKLFELFRDLIRGDSLFIFVWVSTFFIKISLFLYASVVCLGVTMNIKDWNIFVLPISLLTVLLSIYSFSNYQEYFFFFISSFPLFELSIEIIVPLLFFVITITGKQSHKRGV